jgi:hypothetical protein
MKKNQRLIIIIAVICVAAICILPFPTRVHSTFSGSYFSDADESIASDVTIEVDAWKLNYLLRENRLVGTLLVSSSTEAATLPEADLSGAILSDQQGKNWVDFISYFADTNQMEHGCVEFSDSFETISVTYSGRDGYWTTEKANQ